MNNLFAKNTLLATSKVNYSEMSTAITYNHKLCFVFANQFSISQFPYQVPSYLSFSQRTSFEFLFFLFLISAFNVVMEEVNFFMQFDIIYFIQ